MGLRAFLCTFVLVKKPGLIFLLLSLLVGACQDPYREPEVPEVSECALQVQVEPISQPGVAFYWTAYDTLAVYTEAHPTPEPFHLQSGVGKPSAGFVGRTAGSPYIVLYPYWARRSEKLGGKELSFQFPETQKYAATGIGPESGDLSFPEFKKIAEAFGYPYYSAHSNAEMKAVVDTVLKLEGPVFTEIFTDTKQVWEPKSSTKRLEDGTLVSPPLEDLAPFLPREELKKIMLIPLIDEEE